MIARRKLVVLCALLLFFTNTSRHQVVARAQAANTAPISATLSSVDRARLAEAFRLGDAIGDRVWPGWSKAPFAVLLVTPETEFLFRHPAPSLDFARFGYDALLKSDIYYRKRTFPTHYLATFPAIRGSTISVIVVGQAENTSAKTSTPWVVTLLHEHFHQLQDSQPTFYADVNALNLSRGDQTGMWMLNYAFPYEREAVQAQFALMSKLLAEAIREQSRKGAKTQSAAKVRAYLDARQEFQAMLAPDDYKYISFQFWKEGIARYMEYRVAQLAATRYQPGKEFRALKDYRSFAEVARKTYEGIFHQLATQKLGESKREVVYSYGAAEGLLLDKISPEWKRKYLVEKFDLGKLW
jgi:choline dehydrogenase-like flavoprotein